MEVIARLCRGIIAIVVALIIVQPLASERIEMATFMDWNVCRDRLRHH